jgi:predicted lipoprotein with Yx(FWY)xxD motif
MATEDEKPEGDYGIITRPDGSLQWTYKNRPLYGYRADQKPGDQLGEGVGGVWKVAKP